MTLPVPSEIVAVMGTPRLMNNCFDITGLRVLITGGTGGIGTELVAGFLGAGAVVCVMGRSTEALANTIKRHSSHTHNLHAIRGDLSEDEAINSAVLEARTKLGQIDAMVLAHGNVEPGVAIDMTLDSWHRQVQVNLTATFRLAQEVAPEMIARRRGKIITIASMLTFQGGLNVSAYAASKGGVGQLTKALSNEWAPHGVNVNSIAPGYIKTNLNAHVWKDPERYQQVLVRLTSGRWGEPRDLVGPALFLASPASDYLHGVILPVDGGWLAR